MTPDIGAGHAELAREAHQRRDFIELRDRARLVTRQYVHEIKMAPMVTTQIVVVAKGGVVVTDFPVARRTDAIDERSVMQHG